MTTADRIRDLGWLQETFAGRYTLVSLNSESSLALVYRAKSSMNGEPVALKLLQNPTEELLARLQRECPLIEQLHHPNIERVIEIDQVDGIWYLATEFIEGERLGNRMDRVPDPLHLMQDVLEGLAACHGQGVVHRNLTAATILVGTDGGARVADLGLAPPGEGSVADDIRAAGLILRQMLSVQGRDVPTQVHQTLEGTGFATAAEFRNALVRVQPRASKAWPRVAVALVILALGLGAALFRPEHDTARVLAEASRLEGLQRYSDAEAVLRPAARGVSAVPARSALVRVLVLQGKGVQAEEEARQLVKVEPRSPEANGYLALALACQKRMDDATQTLAEAVRLGLRHGRYHAWLVRIAQTEKLKVSLGELFQGGLALEPDSPELLLELCKYQYQMGKFKEALQAAEGLLRRSPTDAIALYLKGLVLLQQQQTAGAIASLEASLKAQPNQPQTQKLLAQLKSQSVPPNWKR